MKKSIKYISILMVLLGMNFSNVHAESSGSYGSDSNVGFYGEYIHKKDSDSNKSPESGVSVNGSNENGASNDVGLAKLPQTGDRSSAQNMFFGGLVILLAFFLLQRKSLRVIDK
ncbi:LPXTG cell wall anchor domain-containing protein [Peribacillus sp. V2I11]|uniref:LPXTG cell wall anchor domain-containing protein n=1 Tax=Peribacillus sp. V2I11 TaxID=3042277 RepID=UPI0027D8F46B|nr:LPXTG cell wall anchor domain-containing protein [Peribacillus sp. V2I11]